ncbi:uncharacterized protein LOC115265267 isoform X2 [Aedes albopictus]|uniref:CIDE-N domain-containing protein n=1 Tax=Aedes albopictus TaxID=7160 RepID=A0ABM2A4E9_AEDAL
MGDKVKIYKVCDVSRINRLALPAHPTIASLLEQGSGAFCKNLQAVYTEADGCRIVTDLALSAFENQLLMLSAENETWTPSSSQYANQSSALEGSGSVVVDSKQDQSTLQVVTVPRIVSVVSEADVLPPSSTQMSATEMIAVQFLNSDEELLLDAELDVQDPIASNADSAQETFEDEIVSVPNEARAAEQRNAELGNSSKATNDGGVQLSKINPDKQGGSEDVENQSPNSSEKRGSSDSVQLHKSSKKHASTEMKFRCFKINWDKLGDSLLNRLRALEDFKRNNRGVPVPVTIRIAKTEVTTLANTVVDQLRMIDTQIRSDVMETAARQVLDKFPALDYTDDDGFGAGQGYVDIKYKLINRNNYLNRFKSPQAALTNTVTSLKKKRNARAGTLKEYWQKSASECDKSSVSALVRDDPSLMTEELLLKTQAFIRWKLDEKVDTKQMISQLPVLRRRLLVNFHFEQATGVNITDLRRYFMMKREKLVQYSLTCKSELHLSKSASDYDILKFLCSLVGEDFGDFIIQKDMSETIKRYSTYTQIGHVCPRELMM